MKTSRLYGLDLLRSLCILIIVYYHSWESVFGDPKVFFSPATSSYGLLSERLAVYLSLGGLGIVFLSFFLVGRSSKVLSKFRVLLIFLGFLAITPPDENGRFSFENLQWSVYAFLIVSYLIVGLISRIPKAEFIFLGLGGILISTRTNFWFEIIGPLSESWSYIVYGQFSDDYVGWPLLPWVGLPLFAWSLGRLSSKFSSYLVTFGKIEGLCWLIIIGLVFWKSETIASYPISRAPFYDHVFNMPALNFWVRLLIFGFLLRLSLIEKIGERLGSYKFIQFNSNLAWNKHFGACYFTEFFFLPVGISFQQYFIDHPRLFDFYWIYVLVATEFTVRLAFYLFDLAKRGK